MCAMCDYTCYDRAEMSRHGIEAHMRHWISLQVIVSGEIITDREQLCKLVNNYIPDR